jgi:tRNA/tmRNA/rRNA uracil-C5-methylase (TrmA/RlmC/RlmD family)
MHIDCLKAIRNCSRIDRLVYVSCNPTKSLVRDCVTLCGPGSKKLFGAPFKPVEATPVDLFPYTPHCEMLLVLERC